MIKIDVRGLDKVNTYLKSLSRGTLRAALEAFSEYIIGSESRGLKHYPPRVQHGEANPYKWNSEKQRRAYFATNGFGKGIPYQRTGDLGRGWAAKYTDGGYQAQITNSTPYAQYVQGNRQQLGHYADKWRHVYTVMRDNLTGAYRAAREAAGKWIKQNR